MPKKKYKPGDPELEKYRVKEEDLPSDFGETIGKLAVQMFLNPWFLAHAEGTILGLEFRVAELEQDLADERKARIHTEGTLEYVLTGNDPEEEKED